MAEGIRGSFVLMLLLCILAFHSNMVHADTYTVGDEKGWTFGVSNWTDGKNFKAGDTLVFNYRNWMHNVVVVDKDAYDSCNALARTGLYFSGADHIQLSKGMNYFICGFPGHCLQGMKIAVNAATS